jgi:hypothetical protein
MTDKMKEESAKAKAMKKREKQHKGLTPIDASLMLQSSDMSLNSELKKFRDYRKPLTMDKLKFLLPCNTTEEWDKAAVILRLVTSNQISLKDAPVHLNDYMNLKRLQRQLLLFLSLNTWEEFEGFYPNHHQREVLETLIKDLGKFTPSPHYVFE